MIATSKTKLTSDSDRVTRWFQMVLGAYEPDGKTFVLEKATVEVEAGGPFGWGERDRIEAAAATRYPDRTLIDWWPIRRPVQ